MYTPDKYDCLDLFAGKARLSKAFAEDGFRACTMDFCRNEADDSRPFLLHIYLKL